MAAAAGFNVCEAADKRYSLEGFVMATAFVRSNVDAALACEFLGVFARFEFALKAGGFAIGDERGVNPNWSQFARAIDQAFRPSENAALELAVTYLLTRPPRRQVLANGHLEWRNAPPDPNLTRAEQVLLMVRHVRNNLFHGGKFLAPDEPENDRGQLLVEHALTVLNACVDLSHSVRTAYEN